MGIKINIEMIRIILFLCISTVYSCSSSETKTSSEKKNNTKSQNIIVPDFNADSAYQYVNQQVMFGPRVPNTDPHVKCAQYLSEQLKKFGADVIIQDAEVKAFDNKTLNAKNIIGQFNKELNDRILLFAHWDSRPFADQSDDPAKQNTPILGASDGASGVGVLLEIARHLSNADLPLGVDIIFFDAEDYGMPDHVETEYIPDTWCLGTQYWAQNPHKKNYYARYGILLDMVGAKNAMFYKERHSMKFAPRVVKKIWNTAYKLNYSNYFIYEDGGMITDDHVYVNKLLGIPCVDIIQHDPATESNFGSYWHTHNDNMDIIDKNTLKAVGQTLLDVIYNEK